MNLCKYIKLAVSQIFATLPRIVADFFAFVGEPMYSPIRPFAVTPHLLRGDSEVSDDRGEYIGSPYK
ncbi:MAG: hypothetical protein ABI597_06055, partial [Gammaproteobacteria bacterium]